MDKLTKSELLLLQNIVDLSLDYEILNEVQSKEALVIAVKLSELTKDAEDG